MPTFQRAATFLAFAALISMSAAASAAQSQPAPAAQKPSQGYAVHNLVSNGVVPTPYLDANLKNTWGVSFNPTGDVWVTNNRTGTSTLYDGQGVPQSLIVAVPPATGTGIGSPTGIVFSGTSDFVVGNGTLSGPSRFIFASEDGLISGWAPNVDLNNAIRVVVNAGAVYKGLAVAQSSIGVRLYATDFHNARVDMFDSAFRKVSAAGAFVDPALPKQLAPFGIQAIGNNLYVTFAKQDGSGGSSASATQANGGDLAAVVDIFTADGKFVRRAATNSTLTQPWGIAIAPADFGVYANRLLVSDFHDGRIGAYDQTKGTFLGYLMDTTGNEIKAPGIWGIQFGNGVDSQPTNTLFFGAGPNGQGGGVYGSVVVAGPK